MSHQDLSLDYIQQIAQELTRHFGVRRVSLVQGGPSSSDPMGEVAQYFGIVDDFGNSFHFGVSDNGRILKAGCTISGKKYELPATEKL